MKVVATGGLGHRRRVNDAGEMAAALRFLAGEAVGERVVATPDRPLGRY